MYKDHITKWELDKRNKEREVMAIVRKKRQRDAVGKASEFRIRGRIVSIEDVHRYLKRKGMSIEDAIARRAATPPNLCCRTPDAVPSSPANPEIFEAHRRILVSIRSYVLGSVESKTWFVDGDSDDLVSTKGIPAKAMHNCADSLFNACSLLEMGSFQKAGKFLVKGSALIRDVLLEECPRLLIKLFEIVFLLRLGGWIDCSNIILNQFSEMAATVLIEMHPLRTIFKCLISFDLELTEDLFVSAWETFTDAIEQTSDSSSPDSIRSRVGYIYWIVRGRDPNIAEGQLRSMVEKCKETHGTLDRRYMEALLGLADFLSVQGRIRDATAVLEELIRRANKCNSQYAPAMWCYGMESLANCQHRNYDDELAESTLRQAINVSGNRCGWQNGYILQLLTKLEGWLTEFGKHDEAAEVSEQTAEILRQSNDFV
jgi:hypothetical protein